MSFVNSKTKEQQQRGRAQNHRSRLFFLFPTMLECRGLFFRVDSSFIRVEADEIAYDFHAILRYEIEKALIEGDIAVANVPGLWNAKMKEYLGVEVTEDRLGCLQDTHWAIGLIGYFPTYTLGSIYAVQIFAAAKEAIPNLEGHLAKGEFHLLKMRLNENVHNHGSLCESRDDFDYQLDWQAFGQFALCEIFDGEVQRDLQPLKEIAEVAVFRNTFVQPPEERFITIGLCHMPGLPG